MTKPAVFLDRDGTINREQGFITQPEDIELLEGTIASLRRLADAALTLVVITNQSGIAQGLYSEDQLARIHESLHLQTEGTIKAWFHCPHHPETTGPLGGACTCRKPAPGLLLQACEILNLTPEGSYIVGDTARDLLAAQQLPIQTVLVRSGKPWQQQLELLRGDGLEPDHIADNLAAATDWILDRHQG